MRLFYDNLIDRAGVALTYASQDDAFPASNVQNELRARPYKTGDTVATEYLVFDLGSAQAVTSVIILDHDIDGTDTTYKLQGNATNSWGAPTFEQVLTHGDGLTSAVFASQSFRYWRITFTKASAATVKSVGRVFLGTYYQATRQPDFGGYEREDEDLSVTQRTAGGQIYADVRGNFRNLRLNFSDIPTAQKSAFQTLAQAVGIHTSFFLQVDETASGELLEIVYCKLRRIPKFKASGVDSDLTWTTALEVYEQL